jgi:epoxyqueuosine reductase
VNNLTSQIKKYAKSAGADLVGIAPADFDEEIIKKIGNYIAKGRHGEMHYLEEFQKRTNPARLLPEVKSVIVIGINYYRKQKAAAKGYGQIARYAYGRDYHKVIKNLLKKIAAFIEKNNPGSKNIICVDSGPIVEKYFAVKAGLGFIGKNTTLITPQYGSFVLLGEIITSLPLKKDKPVKGTCGTCRRCIEACPTKALVAPYEMDARKCISYLTIEKKGEIPKQFHKSIGNNIFGCDICQEVCPYNRVHAKPMNFKGLKDTRIAGDALLLEEVLSIKSNKEFLDRFAGSPLMRAKKEGLQRNAKIAKANK